LLKVALTTISLNQPINGIVIVKEIMYWVKYSFIVAASFIGEGNRKTTDLPQVTDKPYYILLYTSPWPGLILTTGLGSAEVEVLPSWH
jgi:hypothetical protein